MRSVLCLVLVACGSSSSGTDSGRDAAFDGVDAGEGDSALSDGAVSDAPADVADGAALDGAALDGAALDGAALDGAVSDGAALDGAALDGAVSDGAVSDGAVSDGALDAAASDGGGCNLDAVRFAIIARGPLAVGTLCDDVFVCLDDSTTAAAVQAASSVFQCDDETAPGCSGETCAYRNPGGPSLIDADELAEVCAVTQLAPTPDVVCVVYP
ncbi:MAG: hypothetical protein AAGE52_22995 [Myxococcota bacterium]